MIFIVEFINKIMRNEFNLTRRPLWQTFIDGWIKLFDALTQILSFGIFHSSWTMSFCYWCAKRSFSKKVSPK